MKRLTVYFQNFQKFIHEVGNSASIEKIQFMEDVGILRHGDTKIQYEFKKESDLDKVCRENR